MANTYFSFKQFTIDQDKCAMKVCTDACLFGAWTAELNQNYNSGVKTILDIGTGTGLLGLMQAQKFQASIDAIEINTEAAEQAAENVTASPWKNIRVYNTPIATFKTEVKYDLIITNPPFYESSLLSPNEKRNAAMHDSYLTLDRLLVSIEKFISDNGYAAILLPFSRESELAELLTRHKFFTVELARVRQSRNHGFFRSMFFLSRHEQGHPVISDISIHEPERAYTNEFKELLKEYYLNL